MKIEKIQCSKCKKQFTSKKIYKFSWRYNDKVKIYNVSKRKWIHTGYYFLCKKCLDKIIK